MRVGRLACGSEGPPRHPAIVSESAGKVFQNFSKENVFRQDLLLAAQQALLCPPVLYTPLLLYLFEDVPRSGEP